jgi:3-hydroxyisobutyrate dehydrogenase
MAARQTVAVLGAGGLMGFAMARNLARDDFDVRAWNRTSEKAEGLAEFGAEVCQTPADAARGAGVILTMLTDADTVIEAVEQAAQADLGDNVIWLQMSTIGEAGTERCEQVAEKLNLEFVDAPVLGTVAPAEEGKLVVLAAGASRLRDHVQPIFDVVGQRTMWIGDVGDATRLKLATNSWILAVVEGAAETLALAEGMGLDPQLVLDAVSGGALDLPYLQMKGKAILERSFEPSFRLRLAAKDASLVEEAAERRHLDLPLVRTIRQRLAEGVDEHGDKDMSATYLTSAPS